MDITAAPSNRNADQKVRLITSALVAAVFALVLAFGAPDADSSRWDTSIDAHSDLTHELVDIELVDNALANQGK